MDRTTHWDAVYDSKSDAELSWFQQEPALSLQLIREACPPPARVVDVGGGTSVLVDRLLDAGYRAAVLDVSDAALRRVKSRVGDRAAGVQWVVGDVTELADIGRFDLWHDRAVFHFLTDAADRRRYVDLAFRTVSPGGHVVIGAFAPDAPPRCSGLEVRRYDAEALATEFGDRFRFVRDLTETHVTPWGTRQPFTYVVLRADAREPARSHAPPRSAG